MLKLKSQLLLFEKKIVLLGPCLKPTEATVNISGTGSNWRNLFFSFSRISVKLFANKTQL